MANLDHASPSERTSSVQRLFVQHAAPLRGFIVALAPNLAMADDVFQETFLTITAKADAFDVQRDFLAWACGVARMKLMEAGRRVAKQGRPLSDEVLEALSASQPSAEPEENRLRYLAECLPKLSPQSRRIVDLCYQQGHKPAEIARRIEWTVEAVYVALSRSRAVLRQCVDRKMAAEGVPSEE
jgi:RNA polymerase sigma-70 factor (ECF subfamily)